MFKKTMIGAAVAAAMGVSGHALAADAAPSDHTITGNVGLFSQYVFRGLTQTDRKPAVQGGFDYSHSSGLYAGTWASNASWTRDAYSQGNALGAPPSPGYTSGGSLEWDFYGGFKMNFLEDFFFDVGTLYYYYPGAQNSATFLVAPPYPAGSYVKTPSNDTWEIYGAVGWKWISAKLSVSVLDQTFGVKKSSGSTYLDLTANAPLGEWVGVDGLTLVAHAGWQHYSGTDQRNAFIGLQQQSNDNLYSYYDYKLGLTYALPMAFTVGAMWTGTSSLNNLGYGSTSQCVPAAGACGPYPSNLGKSTGTIYIQKTF
jgi:uncharacterized protein (TIGR02001 family)